MSLNDIKVDISKSKYCFWTKLNQNKHTKVGYSTVRWNEVDQCTGSQYITYLSRYNKEITYVIEKNYDSDRLTLIG